VLIVVRDGLRRQWQIWEDGVLGAVTTDTCSGAIHRAPEVSLNHVPRLGFQPGSGSASDGVVTGAAMWNRALSKAEITAATSYWRR
jgi:hypothetical protein